MDKKRGKRYLKIRCWRREETTTSQRGWGGLGGGQRARGAYSNSDHHHIRSHPPSSSNHRLYLPQRVIISQIFLCTSPYLRIEDRTLDVCMRCVERVHSSLCHFSFFDNKYMRDLPWHTTPTHRWRNSWSHLHFSRRVTAEISHLSRLNNVHIQTLELTSRSNECWYRPFIEMINILQVPTDVEYNQHLVLCKKREIRVTYIALFNRTTSSTASKLAWAIIWVTYRSCPLPTLGADPADPGWFILDAPVKAFKVLAKVEEDHDGKFDESG